MTHGLNINLNSSLSTFQARFISFQADKDPIMLWKLLEEYILLLLPEFKIISIFLAAYSTTHVSVGRLSHSAYTYAGLSRICCVNRSCLVRPNVDCGKGNWCRRAGLPHSGPHCIRYVQSPLLSSPLSVRYHPSPG